MDVLKIKNSIKKMPTDDLIIHLIITNLLLAWRDIPKPKINFKAEKVFEEVDRLILIFINYMDELKSILKLDTFSVENVFLYRFQQTKFNSITMYSYYVYDDYSIGLTDAKYTYENIEKVNYGLKIELITRLCKLFPNLDLFKDLNFRCVNQALYNPTIYSLMNFGVTLNTIDKLKQDRFNIYNFETKSLIKYVGLSKAEEIISSIDTLTLSESYYYELLNYGIPLRIINQLVEYKIDIFSIVTFSIDDLIKIFGLSRDEAITLLYGCFNVFIFQTNYFSLDRNIFKTYEITTLIDFLFNCCNNPVPLFSLKRLIRNSNLPIKNIDYQLNVLRKHKIIKLTPKGVVFNILSLEEKINTFDYNGERIIPYIIIEKLKGTSDEEILGSELIMKTNSQIQYDRESINDIFDFYVDKIRFIKEDKYADIFKEYFFLEQVFTETFDESRTVYNYLSKKYGTGKQDVSEILNNSNICDYIKNKIASIIDKEGYVLSSHESILYQLIPSYFNKCQHVDKFDSYYRKYLKRKSINLPKVTSAQLKSFIDDFPGLIEVNKNEYKYIDLSNFNESFFELIEGFLSSITACQGTSYLYDYYKNTMQKYNIQSYHELYALMKELYGNDYMDKLTFLEIPVITTKDTLLDSFLIEVLEKVSPIYITDFLDLLYQRYGLPKEEMSDYINEKLSCYVIGKILDTHIKSAKHFVHTLNSELKDDYYEVKDFLRILENIRNANNNQIFLNQDFLTTINFKLTKNYIFRVKPQKYFINKFKKYRFIKQDQVDQFKDIPPIRNAFNKLTKSFEFIKHTQNEYISIKVLEENGISKETIKQFIEYVINEIGANSYFTIPYLVNKGIIHRAIQDLNLEDLGFDNIFYESIFSTSKLVKNINTKIKIYYTGRENVSLKNFIVHKITRFDEIHEDDLLDDLHDNYGLDLTINKIRSYIKDTEIEYGEHVNKFYRNAEVYGRAIYA